MNKYILYFLLCISLPKINAQSLETNLILDDLLKSTRIFDDSLSFVDQYLNELYTVNVYKDKYISENGIVSFKDRLFIKVDKNNNLPFFPETKIKIDFDQIKSVTFKKGVVKVISSEEDVTLLKITEFNKYLKLVIPYQLRRKQP